MRELRSTIACFRQRELSGHWGTPIGLQMKLESTLNDMVDKEYMYDHPAIDDLVMLLKDRIRANAYCLELLFRCCLAVANESDTSIVWIAHSCGLRCKDEAVLQLVEKINKETL